MRPMLMPNFILRAYEEILKLSVDQASEIGLKIQIPQFTPDIISALITEYKSYLLTRPVLLELEGPIHVVGDIHGNLVDLLRIFGTAGSPANTKYLFMGDYVDRGSFSTECITLLYAFALAYPTNVYLLRGNHEFREVNLHYGFYEEIATSYGDSFLFDAFNDSFNWLPIAATINSSIFCVHGGLAPGFTNLDQIRNFERPIHNFQNDLIAALLWADPSSNCYYFSDSLRGMGVTFGLGAIKDFMSATQMTRIIRAHECVQNGYATFDSGRAITVFSSSAYSVVNEPNKAAFLVVDEQSKIVNFQMKAIVHRPRTPEMFYLYRQPFIAPLDFGGKQFTRKLSLKMKTPHHQDTPQKKPPFIPIRAIPVSNSEELVCKGVNIRTRSTLPRMAKLSFQNPNGPKLQLTKLSPSK